MRSPPSTRPCRPSYTANTSSPAARPLRTTARTAAFMPAESPPLVSTASLAGAVGTRTTLPHQERRLPSRWTQRPGLRNDGGHGSPAVRAARGSEALGRRDGRAVQAGRRALVRRIRRGVRSALRRAGRGRHVHQAERGAASEQLPRPLRPERRGAGRGPHVHLFEDQGRRRSDEQLDGAGGDEGDPPRALRRLHGRSDDVRDPLQHGPARLGDRPAGGARSPTRPTSR